ncbi:MAG: E3 ubiquitin ligase family protein [Spirochaetes bacterium]|nr:E3 ubiquitin ligase family protein [Spirochaetota bacterium]
MIFYVLGGVLVAVAVGLFLGSGSQRRKVYAMKATDTSTAADLRGLADSVAKEIGAGSFNQVTEVKGAVECDSPLTGELSLVPCVHYAMSIRREWEETSWKTDAQGRRTQETNKGSDTVASNTRSVRFRVKDATGAVDVDPSGAKIDGEKAVSTFQPGEPAGGSLTYKGFSISLPGFVGAGGRRTLGYRYEETVVPVGVQVYVLGEAVDAGGTLTVKKPVKKDVRFVISVRSEEELVRKAGSAARGLTIAAAVCVVVAGALAVLAFLGIIGR